MSNDVEIREINNKWIALAENNQGVEFDTEDAACEFQRNWRRLNGLDEMTGTAAPHVPAAVYRIVVVEEMIHGFDIELNQDQIDQAEEAGFEVDKPEQLLSYAEDCGMIDYSYGNVGERTVRFD